MKIEKPFTIILICLGLGLLPVTYIAQKIEKEGGINTKIVNFAYEKTERIYGVECTEKNKITNTSGGNGQITKVELKNGEYLITAFYSFEYALEQATNNPNCKIIKRTGYIWHKLPNL